MSCPCAANHEEQAEASALRRTSAFVCHPAPVFLQAVFDAMVDDGLHVVPSIPCEPRVAVAGCEAGEDGVPKVVVHDGDLGGAAGVRRGVVGVDGPVSVCG